MGLMHESVCLTPLATVVSLDGLLASNATGSSGAFDIPDDTPPLDEFYDAHRAQMAVRDFIETLPPRQRDLIKRVFWDDETQASVARSQGISGAAVSKSLNKVLETGRHQLARFKNTHLNGLQMS